MEFVSTLPKRERSGHVKETIEAILPELQANPGEWGIVWSDLKPGTAAVRAGQLKAIAHISARSIKGTVYASYMAAE